MKTQKFQPGYDTPRTKEQYKLSYEHEIKRYIEVVEENMQITERTAMIFFILGLANGAVFALLYAYWCFI